MGNLYCRPNWALEVSLAVPVARAHTWLSNPPTSQRHSYIIDEKSEQDLMGNLMIKSQMFSDKNSSVVSACFWMFKHQ